MRIKFGPMREAVTGDDKSNEMEDI
jgi:hypothetical protein